jgi:ketosteroid isomerase-like protein
MTEHPNAALYREGWEKFQIGETDAAAAMMDDDIVWWQIGAAEPLRGKAAVLGSMQALEGVDFKLDIHDILANDDHTVALVTATVRAGDQEISYRTTEILHVSDGKITERWAFSDDTERIGEFFAQFS